MEEVSSEGQNVLTIPIHRGTGVILEIFTNGEIRDGGYANAVGQPLGAYAGDLEKLRRLDCTTS